MLKAVLFDLDGVFIETEKETFIFYKKYLKDNHGIILKDSDFEYKAGIKSKDFFNSVLTKEQQKKVDIKRLTETKRELFNSKIEKYAKKIKGGLELLKYLKDKRYLIALVSQNESRMIETTINWLGIKKYFDVILSIDDIKNKKPDPEIYLLAAEKLKVDPDQCIVIEDSYDGISSAKNGNFTCIALKHDYMPRGTYKKADKIVNSLEEIKNIIK